MEIEYNMEIQYDNVNTIFNQSLQRIRDCGLKQIKEEATSGLSEVLWYFGRIKDEYTGGLSRRSISRFEGSMSDYFTVHAAINHVEGDIKQRDRNLQLAWQASDIEREITQR